MPTRKNAAKSTGVTTRARSDKRLQKCDPLIQGAIAHATSEDLADLRTWLDPKAHPTADVGSWITHASVRGGETEDLDDGGLGTQRAGSDSGSIILPASLEGFPSGISAVNENLSAHGGFPPWVA